MSSIKGTHSFSFPFACSAETGWLLCSISRGRGIIQTQQLLAEVTVLSLSPTQGAHSLDHCCAAITHLHLLCKTVALHAGKASRLRVPA